jgi:hypothetical protein
MEEVKGLPGFVLTLKASPSSVRVGEKHEFMGKLTFLGLPSPPTRVEVRYWPAGRPETYLHTYAWTLPDGSYMSWWYPKKENVGSWVAKSYAFLPLLPMVYAIAESREVYFEVRE